MTIALWIFSILIGLASTMSAMGKFTKMEPTVATLKSVGVKDSQIPLLGALELAGALGLVVGIWIPILGQLAAIGLVIYFAGAVTGHARVGHPFKQIMPATVLLVVSLVTTFFQLAR
jgi:predicted lysophospholipase L1 biosynthesis ABC-type transport system permease subunit